MKLDNSQTVEQFQINSVTTSEVYELLKNLDDKKATGTDKLPRKLVKISAKVLSYWRMLKITVFLKEFFLTMWTLHLFPLFEKQSK